MDNFYKDAIETAVAKVIADLEKPWNRDLLMAIVLFDTYGESVPHQSFMLGFTQGFGETTSFEDFARLVRSFDMQMREQNFPGIEDSVEPDVSALYDKYLEHRKLSRNESGLTESQAARFDELINAHDDGWSGFMYGMICRLVQATLRLKYTGSN